LRKHFLAIVVALIVVLSFAGLAQAAPQVILDGRTLTFDVPPIIENDRTLVPLRAIFEALGANVQWDGQTQTVTAVKGSTEAKLTIGSHIAYKKGQPVTLDVPAKIINDRTMVPLRFVSEALGAAVDWNGETQTVTITSNKGEEQTPKQPPATGNYVGSQKSDKYHLPTCRWAEKILPENRVWFQTEEEAVGAGYQPCGVCKP